MMENAWKNFNAGNWQTSIDVRDFIQKNYTPYEGDDKFLAGPTERTGKIMEKVRDLLAQESAKTVLDISKDVGTSILAHAPGYIDKENECIVGLQTDAPLKRAIAPNGGLRMVQNSLDAYGYTMDPKIEEIYTKYRKTHNQGVFDVYNSEIRACRSSHSITGLPDAYGRGRIIGDYRRVALYGIDFLVQQKLREKAELDDAIFDEKVIRLREELTEQVAALQELQQMAASYGFDISKP